MTVSIGGWFVFGPVVVGAWINSGSLTDQYRLVFSSSGELASCFGVGCSFARLGWGGVAWEPLIIYGNTPTFAHIIKVGCPLSCIRPLLLAGIALP